MATPRGGSSSDSLDSLVAGGEGRRTTSDRARERASGASLGAPRGLVSWTASRWRREPAAPSLRLRAVARLADRKHALCTR